MAEWYRYRGRAAPTMSYHGSTWEYFSAYSDSNAKAVFYQLTGLSVRNGDNIEIQLWDDDFGIWIDVD